MQNEQEIAKAALQFLRRVQLQGGEVPAYVMVEQWLSSKIQPTPALVEPEAKSADAKAN